jgi:hypothetical protein
MGANNKQVFNALGGNSRAKYFYKPLRGNIVEMIKKWGIFSGGGKESVETKYPRFYLFSH